MTAHDGTPPKGFGSIWRVTVADCHEMCPETDASSEVHSLTCPSTFSWAPADIHLYLKKETLARRGGATRNNVYNEFIIDGVR
jgi:hypothetical protein